MSTTTIHSELHSSPRSSEGVSSIVVQTHVDPQPRETFSSKLIDVKAVLNKAQKNSPKLVKIRIRPNPIIHYSKIEQKSG